MTQTLQDLITSFQRPAIGEAQAVRGCIQEIHRLDDLNAYKLTVQNGRQEHHFILRLADLPAGWNPPLPGSFVQGVMNPFSDPVSYDGKKYQIIFDFDDVSQGEEKKAEKYFGQLRAYHDRSKAQEKRLERMGIKVNLSDRPRIP